MKLKTKKIFHKLRRANLWGRTRLVRSKRWWLKNDRLYGVWWRLGNGAAAVLILVAAVIPVLQQISTSNSYKLSADALKLVGKTDPTLTKQLTYDSTTQTYQFNKDAIQSGDSSNPLAKMQAQVGTASGKGKDKSLYALDVPQDITKGVTYHDTNSDLSFSLVPQFKGNPGKEVQGHVVFPLSGGNQAVYTLKNNGLKEDIVVPKAVQDSMTFSYQLKLPRTLEAKVIPGSNGAIGIYSADPALFGSISYGSSKDQATVEKARENGAKTYLVFGLPAPIIKPTDGKSAGNASARFVLNGNQLSVVAENMSAIGSPITIDPSVVVTSTSDFQTGGNNEDNIDFGTSGQITRGGLTGGSVGGGWTTNADKTGIYSVRYGHGSVAYNGYLYVAGGYSGGAQLGDTYYALLCTGSNSGVGGCTSTAGSIGDWNSTNSFSTAREYPAMEAYNGYMYIYGGYNSGTTALGDVQYALICTGSNSGVGGCSSTAGSLGTWQTSANAMALAVCRMGYAAYNGYLYATGGDNTAAAQCGNSSTPTTTVQFAPIHADGSVGTWTSSSNQFTSARMSHETLAYNGYLYVIAGTVDGSTNFKDTQYAPILSSGDVGTWVTAAPNLSLTTYRFGATAYNGYIYVIGGPNGGANVSYAPINANGSIGAWQATAALNISLTMATAVAYNGYLYVTAGNPGSGGSNDNQYAKIDPAGQTGAYSSTTFATARRGAQEVAYNGFLYIMGGDAGSTPLTTNTILRATINADGSLGSFSLTTATFTASNYRTLFAAVAYDGFMYVFGGCTSATASCTTAGNNVATVLSASISSSGNIGAWTTQTAFTTARYGLTAVSYRGFVYIMGGLNGSTFKNDVQYASLTNGTVGTWTTATSTFNLPSARAGFAATVYGGNVYIAGGCTAGNLTTCTTRQNDVYYAPLSSSGGFSSTWSGAGAAPSFTNARYGLTLSAASGFLYITSGYNGTTYYSDTQYAPLSSAGGVGSWVTAAGSTQSVANWGTSATTYRGYLYVSGGINGSTYSNTLYYAPINNGGQGTAGTWTDLDGTSGKTDITGAFGGVTDWVYGGTIAANGYIYVMGGFVNGASAINDEYSYAQLNSDGSMGSWTTPTSKLWIGQGQGGYVYANGYIYIISGNSGAGGSAGTTQAQTTQYAPVCTAANLGTLGCSTVGDLGTWNKTSNDLPLGGTLGTPGLRHFIQASTYNGYIYIAGGQSRTAVAQADVQYALICTGSNSGTGCSGASTPGDLGTWQDLTGTSGFTTARFGNASFAYNGYLYVAGGYTGSVYLDDVQYAPLNSDGSITAGAWKYTSELPMNVSNSITRYINMFAYDGVMWQVGGNSAPAFMAAINSNGTLGPWQTTTSMTNRRIHAAWTVYNGYLYGLGGEQSTSIYISDTEYTPLNVIPRAAHYSKLIDLGTTANVTGITASNSAGVAAAAITYRAAGSDGVFGSSAPASSASGSGTCVGTTAHTRYLFINVTLDDSNGLGTGGGLPDANGTNSNLAVLTVSYNAAHPAPNIRLRAGQTLQSGNLSALDTCYP